MYGELKNVLPSSVQKNPLTRAKPKSSPLLGGRYGIDNEKMQKFRAPQSPWYRVCTKAMVTSEGSYVYGELKKVLPSSVQKTPLPVRGRKIARYMGGGMDREWKNAKFRAPQLPWYRVCTKAMVTS